MKLGADRVFEYKSASVAGHIAGQLDRDQLLCACIYLDRGDVASARQVSVPSHDRSSSSRPRIISYQATVPTGQSQYGIWHGRPGWSYTHTTGCLGWIPRQSTDAWQTSKLLQAPDCSDDRTGEVRVALDMLKNGVLRGSKSFLSDDWDCFSPSIECHVC
ncbi:hypothetical protein FA10DRAFT_51565 [Acaromyces ingoldii]|uniref:Uncharacterized protein n=1 Tax=Acaromyces ingoldii TaxID=215250 RepID=A0A316YCX5_9BASI|nr:hypothetical protein FA10DRAFT_51565 [Acaromyces ingoldii]PWN86704.1 hypothetical protein FA10DRAFT_51565 [Acaromyces ingoldii]